MKLTTILFLLISLGLVSCVSQAEDGDESSEPNQLTMLSHDSFAISEEVLAEFEDQHDAKIVLLPAGDAGSTLNQAILSRDNPLADLFFGVDNTFMSRALEEDIFEPYQTTALANVSESLRLDDTFRLTPVDYGDVCLNYDIEWFSQQGISPPMTINDLAKLEYQSLTVVENPATSSPGLAFLLATSCQLRSLALLIVTS